jgi:hypothetical protein
MLRYLGRSMLGSGALADAPDQSGCGGECRDGVRACVLERLGDRVVVGGAGEDRGACHNRNNRPVSTLPMTTEAVRW